MNKTTISHICMVVPLVFILAAAVVPWYYPAGLWCLVWVGSISRKGRGQEVLEKARLEAFRS